MLFLISNPHQTYTKQETAIGNDYKWPLLSKLNNLYLIQNSTITTSSSQICLKIWCPETTTTWWATKTFYCCRLFAIINNWCYIQPYYYYQSFSLL